jgi:hypothetical protein
VNPDSALRRIATAEGWEVVELDRLGRRLKLLAALGAGTALWSLARVVLEREQPQRRRILRPTASGASAIQSRGSGPRGALRGARGRLIRR